MRFRQGPLLEASAIYVVASVVSFIALIGVFGLDFASITGAFTVEAMFLLLPSFFLWAVSGQFTKNKSFFVRFFVQISINSVLVVLALILLNNLVASGQTANKAPINMSIAYVVFACYYIGALVGSIFTNFWFVKRAQAAELIEIAKVKGKK